MEIREIPIDKIKPNSQQSRENFDKEKLQELAESILSNGLINAVTVREVKDGYEIVAGERRWKASKIAKLKTIQAIVKRYENDVDWQIESLVENLQREDLNSIERENNIYALWKTGKFKSFAELSRRLGYRGNSQYIMGDLIKAKEDRDRIGVRTPLITSQTLHVTEGLKDSERKALFKKVENGKLLPERLKEIAPIMRKAPEDVKEALLDDKINVEQAKSISKFKDKNMRERAIKEHHEIRDMDKHVESHVKTLESMKNKRGFDKNLLQVKNWLCSFRNSVTDARQKLEMSLKLLIVLYMKFLPVMDEKQREYMLVHLDRLEEMTNKTSELIAKIRDKIE